MPNHGERRVDGQWFSAPAERNKGPIVEVLARVLPHRGAVLEIASGTGQHIAHFARALPALTWLPSDADPELREAVDSRIREGRLPNARSAIELNVCTLPWPIHAADAVVCINMIHVAPWPATLALFAGAKAVLPDGAVLFLYGPYRRFGAHTSPSNAQFDRDLRARDPAWGVRDLEAVVETAGASAFTLAELVAMPANNFSLVFRKT